MNQELINLFECESSFQVRKEIHQITDGLKLDLLVELNNTFYFQYLINKLKEQVSKIPKENDEVIKKNFFKQNGEEFDFDNLDFVIYHLENGILSRSESILKVENVSLEAYLQVDSESSTFIEILNEYLNEIYQNQNRQTEPEAIDLSDTTATEKIIYLHKLGVIDFLRNQQPFQSSTNSLASVLSAVTGAKSGTIQPMLNAMLSKETLQKNNPLNSQKPLNKVTKQLNEIGFNLNETI